MNGVILYAAAQRTHEIGVRMALGAGRGDILKRILRQGFVLVGGGVFLGLLITVVFMRLLSAFVSALFVGVSPTDPRLSGWFQFCWQQ